MQTNSSIRKSTVAGSLLLLTVGLITASVGIVTAEENPEIEWIRQFGSGNTDFGRSVAVDDSGVYVTGSASGALPGQSLTGDSDAYLQKYDHDGNAAWTRQFGVASAVTFGDAVATDGSGVYVAGRTTGALEGISAGLQDAFLRKYDTDGNVLWTRQFGTSANDAAFAVAVDVSGVYVGGSVGAALPGESYAGGNHDPFVRKYDHAGSVVWTDQFGSSVLSAAERVTALAADGSNVYAAGFTPGTLAEPNVGAVDAFIRSYDADAGVIEWTRQFGTSEVDSAQGVAASASGVYVVGATTGTFPGQPVAGDQDAFLRRYHPDGSEAWTRQFGTDGVDAAWDVDADAFAAYVAGSLRGTSPFANRDIFLRKYDPSGSEAWTQELDTGEDDVASGVDLAETVIYIAGDTKGTFPDQPATGSQDAFVAKLSQASEVAVDVKPVSCPNPLNVENQGELPVAILGESGFDVTLIDSLSVRLEDIAPVRVAFEDVATPFEPFTGKAEATDCTDAGPDGFADLTLKFDVQAVVEALGSVEDGDVVVLHLTGELTDGTPFVGEDVVRIVDK